MSEHASDISGTDQPTVLVVDDDEHLSAALCRVLRRYGFSVEVALDGRDAITKLETKPFNVMVLDLRMPRLDGLELIERGARNPSWPRIILHSAFLDVPTTVLAMRAGVADVVEKPAPAAELVERIRAICPDNDRSSGTRFALRTHLRGDSPVMQDLRDHIRRVSRFDDMSVLIEGPTGTGKELVAEAIHQSTCPTEPLVALNCAAVPTHLFESELFGHDSGAFTGARTARLGLLGEAGSGTLFLDEVGEMPPELQPKLLRVLEAREFRPVGSNRTRPFRARVVSATNRPLTGTNGGPLRSDLYFRLAGYTIATTPLRDYASDIPDLARHFCAEFSRRHDAPIATLAADALEALIVYEWPGNVRELRSVVENAVVRTIDGVVRGEDVQAAIAQRSSTSDMGPEAHGRHPVSATMRKASSQSLPELERQLILEAFSASGHNLSQAARHLGIPRSTLRDKLRKYGAR